MKNREAHTQALEDAQKTLDESKLTLFEAAPLQYIDYRAALYAWVGMQNAVDDMDDSYEQGAVDALTHAAESAEEFIHSAEERLSEAAPDEHAAWSVAVEAVQKAIEAAAADAGLDGVDTFPVYV